MNTQAKHTPGPWRAEIEDYPFRREIYIETQDFDPDVGEGERIARVLDETDNGRANARLIAASPALLDALRYAAEAIELLLKVTPKEKAARNWAKKRGNDARAAIAQAEGGAQ